MKSLTEILADQRTLVDALIETGGEISPEVETMMASIQAQLVEKTDSYFYVMDGLNLTSEDLKEKAKMFSSAAKALESAADRLKENVRQHMILNNLERLTGEMIEFSLRKTKPRTLISQEELPEEYLKFTPVVDKEAVDAALKEGKEIPGVRQEGGFALFMGAPRKMKTAKAKS